MENELSRIVDALPGLVWTALPDGRIDFLNQRWREYTGLDVEETHGLGWQTAIHPEDLSELLASWNCILASGQPGEMEARLRRRDGEYRWFLFRVCPLAAASGQIEKWCGINTDIEGQRRAGGGRGQRLSSPTRENHFRALLDGLPSEMDFDDQKRAEALLAGERRLLAMVAGGHALPGILEAICQLVEGMASGCYCSVVLVDASGARLEHGAAPSLPASFIASIIGRPVNADSGPCAMAAHLDEQVITADLRLETRWAADGWSQMALAHGLQACWSSPISSAAGKVLGAFAIYYREPRTPTPLDQRLVEQCTHIASIAVEGAQSRAALKRSEARKTAILESALDCIITIDHEGCITEFNPAAERTFGYRRDEVVGRGLAEVIIPQSLREMHRQGLARYLATGEARVIGRHVEMTALRADGSEFPVELAITRIPLDGPPSFTGYLRDITGRKRFEEEFRRSKVYLEHAQKLSHTGSVGFRLSDGQLFWSEETAHIYGYDPAIPPTMEMILQRVHPEDSGLLTEVFGRAVQGGASFDFEHRLLMQDGSIKHVRSFADSVKDEAGKEEVLGAVMDITERHKTEADLQDVLERVKESETEFRAILEGIPTLAWSTRADGCAEFFSQRWLDYSGMSNDEVQGMGWTHAVHPNDIETLSDQWAKIMASEKTGEVEARLRRFDGEYRWFLFRAAPFVDHHGKVLKWYGTNTDIDDLKRAKTLLAGEKRLLEIIAKGESLSVTLTNLCLFVEELCPDCACCSLLMLDPETNRLWHAASPSVAREYTAAIDGFTIGPEVSSCGTAAFHRTQVVASDVATDPRWAEFRDVALANGLRACWSTPIFSSEGAVLGTFAMFARAPRSPTTRDQEVIEQITHLATIAIERSRGEEALRRSRAYMAEAQRLSCTGSFGWNVSSKKILWSEESFRIFGYEPTCTPTIDLVIDRVHPEDVARVRNIIARASRDGTDWEVGHRLLMPDGEVKYVHVAARAGKDEIGNLEFVGALVDVTEPTRADEELRRSEAALRKAQSELAHVTRVTTMGELAASIAHEVNQPIAGVVINGNACLRWLARVNEESTNLAEAREALQRIIRDANRTGEIVARIRALFKKTDAAKEPLDLDETVREVIVLARSELERQRIALRLELSPNLPRILGDRVQLQQVMLNLILNAIEAMATVEGRARDLVILAKSRAEGDVLVTVCDSGIGLDSVNGERIFEAFHTTKPTGLGMGLSISRSIVDNHSGRLWVTTNDGPGVSFHFTLPASL